MEKKEFKECVQKHLELAKKNLEKEGELIPVVLMFTVGGEMCVVACPFKNDREKAALKLALKEMAKEQNCEAAIMINEAWMVVVEKEEDYDPEVDPMPRERPLRKEVIVIAGNWRNRVSLGAYQVFTKDELGNIVWEESELPNEFVHGENTFLDGICIDPQ
jgi:hypothetical protein